MAPDVPIARRSIRVDAPYRQGETTMQTCTSVAAAQGGGLHVSVDGAQPGAEHERRGASAHQGGVELSSNDPVDGDEIGAMWAFQTRFGA